MVVANAVANISATFGPNFSPTPIHLLSAMKGVSFPGVSNAVVHFVGNSIPTHSYGLLNVVRQQELSVRHVLVPKLILL